ncbi:MAG: outer membrane channel protein TolC [Candidatus Magnetoglobus multicellularis str. Araruama]|uniref:Outer membrane channel protein TolC n=1 Tax=Candidatus Magnetoglobus multicellularis str. Araruama TaxID=890399 RepID=A0A1V1P9L3_9BACT|nr:MAG: outer membrane channel protein TolC [Candidatus Magnetoglobus multicellularis str. Araruama]
MKRKTMMINDLKIHTPLWLYKTIVFTGILLLWVQADFLRATNLIDLQNEAVKNRKVIEKYQIRIDQQDVALRMNKSENWPKFDLEYSLLKVDKHLSPVDKYTEFETILSYSIFSGYKYYFKEISLLHLKNAKEFERNSMIQDIKYIIAANYLHIFDSKSLLKVAEDEYKLLQKRYKDALNRHKVGIIKKNDLLKIKVELDHANQKTDKARADFEKSLNDMEHETGIQVNIDEITFEEFDALPKTEDLVFYLSKTARRHEIKALEQLIAAKKYSLESQKSNYYPLINFSAEYYRYEDDYMFGFGDHYDEDIRMKLSLKMNCFNGFKDYYTIQSTSLDIKQLKCDLHELKKKLTIAVENTFLDYEVSLKNLKVAQDSIAQAEENLRITDMSFNQGVAKTADILDAIYYLSRAKYNFIYAGGKLFLNYYQLTRLADNF